MPDKNKQLHCMRSEMGHNVFMSETNPYEIETLDTVQGDRTPSPALSLQDIHGVSLENFSGAALSELAADIIIEQHRRALIEADPQALASWGFANMFDSRGVPNDPTVMSGMVVIAGYIVEKSSSSHLCCWATIGEDWVWESEEVLVHESKHPVGPKKTQRGVSVAVAVEGMKIDMVFMRQSLRVHEMQKVRSFEIQKGKMVQTQARAKKATTSH